MSEQYNDIFILDVEATSNTPMTGVMTEIGIVHMMSGDSFYGHLYDFHPHPDIPALPVVDLDDKGDPIINPHWRITKGGVVVSEQASPKRYPLAQALRVWVSMICAERPKMVSDNNGYDAMWFNCFMDEMGLPLTFGYSSGRIGNYYAGTKGKWYRQSDWKRLRKTEHTHDPVDDARGNAEALRIILGIDPPL